MMYEQQCNIDESMSLFIPHIFPNFDVKYIAGVFEGLDFGCVHHVDLVAKMDRNGNIFNAAFVHFSKWSNSTMVSNFQDKVKDPEKDARIMHDDPWYWIVLENKAKKHIPGERKQRINLSVVNLENEEYIEGNWEEGECEEGNWEEGECEEGNWEEGNWEEDEWYQDIIKKNNDIHQSLILELAELREKNINLYDIIDNKNEIITMLQHDNEQLRLDLQESRWLEMNAEMVNDELEARIQAEREMDAEMLRLRSPTLATANILKKY